MQLTIKFIALCLLAPLCVMGQSTKKTVEMREKQESNEIWFRNNAFTETTVNILTSYYQQDGDNSPVTGGRGTEELTDLTPTIIINVPLDSTKQLTINFGVDFYSSASTDNIDLDVSSDSEKDSRKHLEVTYTKRIPYRRETFSVSVGYSKEYDVNSASVGVSLAKESFDGNRAISLAASVFFDQWGLYYPIEFREANTGDGQESENRTSYSFALTYSQVLTKKLQASVTTEIVYQTGLLSTPFHRVFFDDGVDVTGLTELELIRSTKLREIESLPDSRLKFPIGLRLNYFASDKLVLRFNYRFYTDDFGVIGNTVGLEVPVKIGTFFSVIPFYRYHTQTAADYFKPFGQHVSGSEFFTSDFDLSNFHSNKVGIGLRYSPLYGIGRFKLPFTRRSRNKMVNLKGVDVRYAQYYRSDGLDASIISFDLSFSINPKK